jgi:glycosyltransferase involved in cell wall biosynthesis
VRVLLVNYELPPIGGGAGNATAHIARCLAASGDEVYVLTSRFRGLATCEVRDGYRIWRVPARRGRAERSSPAEMLTFVLGGAVPALRLAQRWRPEAACAFFGLPSGALTLSLERRFGIPYLVSLRGGDVPGFLPEDLGGFHRLARPAILSIWRRSRGLIANSAGLADLACQAWPDAPVHVVPNGVDTQGFRPPTDRARPATPLRVLCVGRLVRQKGFEFAIEAVSAARAPSLLRIVGDGPLRASLTAQAARLGAAVDFAGWVERRDLPSHYQWADVLCLPSYEEGMPNVVLEAMASGLPTIASDVYGMRDLVQPGQTGVVVPPGSSRAIAAALEHLAAEPSLVRVMGEQARRLAERYAWSEVAADYRRLLRAAAAGRR